VRAAVVLAALLLLAVPLRSVTSGRARVAPPAPPEAASEVPARLAITSTKTPFTYTVEHLGRVVWNGTATAGTVESDIRLPIPAEGVDLAVQIEWTTPGIAAAKITLAHGGESGSRTLWGDGVAADVLTFP
jgi:hypothetical protein